MKLLNAISLNMIKGDGIIKTEKISRAEASRCLFGIGMTCESYIGHTDLANVLGVELGGKIQVSRKNAILNRNGAVVAQYTGPRLQEGTTNLPDGADIQYWYVEASYPCPSCGNYDCDGCE